MRKFKSKKLPVVLSLTASICSMNVNSAKLGELEISINGNILAQPCTLVEINESNMFITLPDTTMASALSLKKGNNAKEYDIDQKIKIQCNAGEKAKLSITANKSDECITGTNAGYICSAENKTIGISPVFIWTQPDGSVSNFNGFTMVDSGQPRSIKLDENKTAEINFPKVYLRAIKDVDPAPGPIAANLTLTIWED